MTNKEIIDKLDFSGGQNSFFDFWHLHVDFDGDGNKDWETRKRFLDEQLELFDYIKTKLIDYPHPFQLWIGIDEDDSSQDGIYIHTPNPNSDYFPHYVDNDHKVDYKVKELKDYLDKSKLTVMKSTNFDSIYYFLFDEKFGVTLKKTVANKD